MKVLTEVDGIALSELCQTYATLKKAQVGLNLITKNTRGKLVANPLLSIIRDCSYRLLQLCREFGLTPAARSRIQMIDEGEKDAPDSLLNGRWKPSAPPKKDTTRPTSGLPVLEGSCGQSSTVLQ